MREYVLYALSLDVLCVPHPSILVSTCTVNNCYYSNRLWGRANTHMHIATSTLAHTCAHTRTVGTYMHANVFSECDVYLVQYEGSVVKCSRHIVRHFTTIIIRSIALTSTSTYNLTLGTLSSFSATLSITVACHPCCQCTYLR